MERDVEENGEEENGDRDQAAGEVKIDGVPVRDISSEQLRHLLAVVPQDPVLFHGSIAENIRFGDPEATDEQVREAVRIAQLDGLDRIGLPGLERADEAGTEPSEGHRPSGRRPKRRSCSATAPSVSAV